jgi:hypothetical protein
LSCSLKAPPWADTLVNGPAAITLLLTSSQKTHGAILTVVGLADSELIDFVMDSELAKKIAVGFVY